MRELEKRRSTIRPVAMLIVGMVAALVVVARSAVSPSQAVAGVVTVLVVSMALLIVLVMPWQRIPVTQADRDAALASLSSEHVERSKQLNRALRLPGYLGLAVGMPINLGLALTPVGPALIGALAAPFGESHVAQVGLGVTVLTLIGQVTLPFAAWEHTILKRFGLTSQSWRSWTVDVLKGIAVNVVFLLVMVTCIYFTISWSPDWWWLWAVGFLAVFAILVGFVSPILILPIFFKFTPMDNGPLRDRLTALAARDQVKMPKWCIVDASRRTNTGNAGVAGIGPTRRFVLCDTLFKTPDEAAIVPATSDKSARSALGKNQLVGATDDEIACIVGHELSHAKYGDLLTRLPLIMIQFALVSCLLFVLNRWHGLLGWLHVQSVTDGRALALLLMVLGLQAWFGPLNNLLFRRIEAAADWHALVLTGDPGAFEKTWWRLAQTNLADPTPSWLSYVLNWDHPSIPRRLAMALVYRRITDNP